MKILTHKFKIILLLVILTVLPRTGFSAESIAINLSAANPGTERVEKKPVRFYLPHELSRADIVDSGTMDVKFDESRSTLYLFKEADLEPGEVAQFRVVFKDVWRIKDEEFDFLFSQIDSRLKYLENSKEYDSAVLYANYLKDKIRDIQKKQKESDGKDTAQRIDDYRIYMDQINEIRENITAMSDFVREALRFQDKQEAEGVLKFVVKAKNPLDKNVEDRMIRKYLPRGVAADQMIDTAGFDLKYDPGKNLYYLEKRVSFGSNESKVFEVTIKNVWVTSEEKVQDKMKEADDLRVKLVDTQYETTGQELYKEIEVLGKAIIDLQNSSKSALEIIANFSLNETRMNGIDESIDRLRKLVEEIENQVPQTVPFYTKPMTPDVSTTWKIIFGVIGFIIVLSGIFYVLLAVKAGKQMNTKYENYEG